jgi:hypothetical protein
MLLAKKAYKKLQNIIIKKFVVVVGNV